MKMNSTENVTSSVLTDDTTPEPGIRGSIYSLIIMTSICLTVLLVVFAILRWRRKKLISDPTLRNELGHTETNIHEHPMLGSIEQNIKNETRTIEIIDEYENLEPLLSNGSIILDVNDRDNNGTENSSSATYIKKVPSAIEYRLGPIGQDFEHEVDIQLLSTGNTVTDKSESCYNNDKNEQLPTASVKPFIDSHKACTYDFTEIRISTSNLLKSPVGNDDESIDETLPKELVKSEELNVETNLDWNRVFRFLANHLDAGKWILFFSILYDNTSKRGPLNVTAKLRQVEQDMKQRVGWDTVTLLLEQFKTWKEFSGKNAKLEVIYRTLQDLEWNDTLEKIETFMRNPPVLPAYTHVEPYTTGRQSPLSENSLSLSLPSLNASVLSLPESTNAIEKAQAHGEILSGHVSFPSLAGKYTCKRVCEVSYEIQNKLTSEKGISDERDEPAGASMINSLNQANPETVLGENQSPSDSADQCIETKEVIVPCQSLQKKAKLSSSNDKTRRKRHCHSKRKRKKFSKFSKRSFFMLIESFLQNTKAVLRKDMYTLFLQKTISDIKKEAKESEYVVLSLTCNEYHDAVEVKTKKETFYVIYSEDIRLTFGVSAFQELQLYTDKARQQVIDRVGPDINREDKQYLFIDYDGKRIQSQKCDGDLGDEASSDDSSLKRVSSLSDSSDDDSMIVSW